MLLGMAREIIQKYENKKMVLVQSLIKSQNIISIPDFMGS